MKKPSLRNVLHSALQAAMAVPIVVAAGCGSGAINVSLFNGPLCTDAGNTSVEGLRPTQPVDFLQQLQFSGQAPMWQKAVLSQTGTACKTAVDPTTCTSALSSAPEQAVSQLPGSCAPFSCIRNVLVSTRGDQVDVQETRDKMIAFLAPIDTEQEAVFVVQSMGYQVSCSLRSQGAVRSVDGGYEVVATTNQVCSGPGLLQKLFFVDGNGKLQEQQSYTLSPGNPNCVIGRRPMGLRSVGKRAASGCVLGQHFARSARLEAAAVTAFHRLHAELKQHEAPRRLLRRIEAAARDEVRHTRQTSTMARRLGATPQRPSVRRPGTRSLYFIARENAVEGCVRETYGALVGLWQQGHAQDPAIARLMTLIADDEVRHATLSWDIAHWLLPRLSDRQRQRIVVAQRQALARLWQELQTHPPTDLVRAAGLPDAAQAQVLLQQLSARLWSTPDAAPAV